MRLRNLTRTEARGITVTGPSYHSPPKSACGFPRVPAAGNLHDAVTLVDDSEEMIQPDHLPETPVESLTSFFDPAKAFQLHGK